MGQSTTTQIKEKMDSLFGLIDNLDRRGVGRLLPFVDGDNGFRELVKADMLLFIVKIADDDGNMISQECLDYINECLDYDFSTLTFELARKKAIDTNLPNICLAIPIFILMDKMIGGNRLSSAYMQALSYVMLGYIKCEDNNSLEKMVKYYRLSDGCIHMIEKSLGEKVDYDPLNMLEDSTAEIIRLAAEIDKKVHKDDPIISHVEDAIRTTINEDNEAEPIQKVEPEENEQELFKDDGDGTDLDDEITADLIKDDGYGSDLEDEVLDISGVTPIHRQQDKELTAMEELNNLIGLREVKAQVSTMLNVLKVRKRCDELNVKRPGISMHMVFTGNPGTGKTTVARIIGKIYHEAGLLSQGQFTEVTRTELVGKYVGHTAPMVKSVFEKAKGGVLFIDEAYSLTSEGDSFGDEAIETLLKLMEDNRDDIVVIVAGYPKLMQDFLESNPGLRSRFPFVVEFPDYSGEELTRIFKIFCSENDIVASRDILKAVEVHFDHEASKKIRNNGNARGVRNYFEKMIMNQANRLVKANQMKRDDLCRFTREDLPDTIGIKPMKLPQERQFTVV